ncbi:MAG: tetratricopeptide repeat protein [Candidatus Bruticola sp.]
MSKRFITSFAAAALLGVSLSFAAPVQAADEASQVLMLRRVFSAPVEAWPTVLKNNTRLIDKSFFERVEARIKWSIDNGQVEDAVRFAYVGDLAGQAVGRKTDYRMQMSQLFRKLGNFSMSLDLINNVCILEPDNKEAQFYKASVLQDAGNNIDCYPIYEDLAKKNYRRSECYYRMSLLELQRSEIELARDHLKECIKLDSKHEPAKRELAKIEEALAKATFVPKSGTDSAALPVGNLGNLPIATSDNSKAIALAGQGYEALKAGSISKAKDLYAQALKLNATAPQALLGAGLIAYRDGDIESAILSLTAAAKAYGGSNAEVEHYLGCCYERRYDLNKNREDLKSAQAHFIKCKQINDNHPMVKMDLERIESRLKK